MANDRIMQDAMTQLPHLDPEPVHGVEQLRSVPPPLPPRRPPPQQQAPPPSYSACPSSDLKISDIIPQEYNATAGETQWSSMQSLHPSESASDGRRALLLIYIHGFMGNEASFQSFPNHVHKLLSMALQETHVVHTKIYPRYKSRKAIDFARDEFSEWLEPHEAPSVDIVLLGHSMGGILGVEVALMPPISPEAGREFRHRILGTISFDTPFLGMHPGLIISGISSLFRTAPVQAAVPEPAQTDSPASIATPSLASQSQESVTSAQETATSISQTLSHDSSTSELPSKDPYYNPPFPNDTYRPQRTGWNKFYHFVSKHSDGLASATKQYFVSHIEFGSCLADFHGLKSRYARIRALEDVDELANRHQQDSSSTTRIRFLNYYTASTGILKKPKTQAQPISEERSSSEEVAEHVDALSIKESHGDGAMDLSPDTAEVEVVSTPGDDNTVSASPIKLQMQNLGEASGVEVEDTGLPAMRHIDSMPIEDDSDEFFDAISSGDGAAPDLETISHDSEAPSSQPSLPPIPAIPEEPQPIDLSKYTAKDERKIAEKEQKRVLKAYQQAVKNRENAIKDRRKLIEKREKKLRQAREKQLREEQRQIEKEQIEEEKQRGTANPSTAENQSPSEKQKPKRDRKFCLLPAEINGKRDPCWVRVYMEGVDEVGAHCGLFFPGPQYETLVGDVADRVEEWLKDDATIQMVLKAEHVD